MQGIILFIFPAALVDGNKNATFFFSSVQIVHKKKK